MSEIPYKLAKIKRVLDTDSLLNTNLDSKYISDYYSVNKRAYSLLRPKGYVHMGITRNGRFKQKDLIEPVKMVESYVRKLEERANILELACGRGANLSFLAKLHPDKIFTGVDLSDTQLEFADRKQAELKNTSFNKGDYHNLTSFQDESVDVCYIIEALCYSKDKQAVLREVSRVLKRGGLFIVIDGYPAKSDGDYSEEELLALKLTEYGMAVPHSDTYSAFVNFAEECGFDKVFEEDVSEYVLPSAQELAKPTKAFFANPGMGRFMTKLLPDLFVYNTISGYLMRTLLAEGVACYMVTVFKNGIEK